MHKLLIYLFTSVLHASGFLLSHLHRQVYILGCCSSLLGADTIPRRLEPLPKLYTCI
jgi:galactose-1-phosphate uridylyltransferase